LGPRERPPFGVTNYRAAGSQTSRVQQREARARRSIDDGGTDGPGCSGPDPPYDYCGSGPDWIGESDEDGDEITPLGRKCELQAWCNTRCGHLADLISDELDRRGLVDDGYVVHQQGSAHDWDPHHVANRRTPSPGATARVPLDQTEPRLKAGPRKADSMRAAGAGPTEGPPPTSDVDVVEVILGDIRRQAGRSRYEQG
jgi:hypothetical protein